MILCHPRTVPAVKFLVQGDLSVTFWEKGKEHCLTLRDRSEGSVFIHNLIFLKFGLFAMF